MLLSASAIHRSFDSIRSLVLLTIVMPIVVILLFIIVAIIVSPFLILFNKYTKNNSVASFVFDLFALSGLILIGILISAIYITYFLIQIYEPYKLIWPEPPNLFWLTFYTFISITILFSLIGNGQFYEWVFATKNLSSEENSKDQFLKNNNNSKIVSDWSLRQSEGNQTINTESAWDDFL